MSPQSVIRITPIFASPEWSRLDSEGYEWDTARLSKLRLGGFINVCTAGADSMIEQNWPIERNLIQPSIMIWTRKILRCQRRFCQIGMSNGVCPADLAVNSHIASQWDIGSTSSVRVWQPWHSPVKGNSPSVSGGMIDVIMMLAADMRSGASLHIDL